jgi:hypothetical protein
MRAWYVCFLVSKVSNFHNQLRENEGICKHFSDVSLTFAHGLLVKACVGALVHKSDVPFFEWNLQAFPVVG